MWSSNGESKPPKRIQISIHILLVASFFLATSIPTGDAHPESAQSPVKSASFTHQFKEFAAKRSSHVKDHPISPINFDTIELAEYYGYGAERHWVTTEDGYILQVHQIFNTTVGNEKSKPVVVLHHGFLLSSRVFLDLGPGKALGFMLADEGYDVWLCNARGNTYSRNHTHLSPNEKKFWKFSYTEYGLDLRPVIDYAIKVTGMSKVRVVAYSVGTASTLILGARSPEYLSKIQSYTALAPLTTTKNAKSPVLQKAFKHYQGIVKAFKMAGIHEFLPRTKWRAKAGKAVCGNDRKTQKICVKFIFAAFGKNKLFDPVVLPQIVAHTPAGSSLNTFRHFGQNHVSGSFREYDFGKKRNLKKYGSMEPPEFDYSKVRKLPSQMFYSQNDWMADPENAKKICNDTGVDANDCHLVDDPNFTHADFVWGSHAHKVVYPMLIEGLRKFDNKPAPNSV